MKEFVLKLNTNEGNFHIDYQKELNSEQFEVVREGEGPCLVLAGAGSGKTRTITYRVAYLIERGVAPENILLVTFTNKAAKEMLSRVEMLLGRYPQGLWGGTFHSIANRVLRKYAAQVSRTSNFTILDTEDSKDLIKVCLKELKIDATARRFPSPAKLHGILSYARNAARGIDDVVESRHSNFSDIIPQIERIAEMYESRKLAADAVDFDDLLLFWRDLLRDNAAVRERLSSQFQYILVDEYQDTNVIQADIIRQLASYHQNALVVGDDAQSIYSFRAAQIRNILNFPEAFFNTKTFRLTTNYRSTPQILELANSVIAQNQEQFKKDLQAVRAGFEKPNLVPAANSAQEAQYIAEQILSLREEGVAMPDMAVLFRAAFHSQALEFELMKRDIPYEYRGGMKFFERAHIKDAIAHLRIVGNCKDETAWLRVLGLQAGIGLSTAGKIFDQLRACKRIDEVPEQKMILGARAEIGWKSLMNTVRKMIAGNRRPADMIKAVAAGDYRDYLEAEYPDFMERLEDLEQLALFAENYDNLVKFLDEVTLTEDYGAVRDKAAPPDEERIILSTVHQAKGLEWDTVFVMNLSEGKFPNQRALDEEGGLEEERRLFYVAATRAERRLFLTYPITSGYDTLAIGQPSRFLLELPEDLVEKVRLKQPAVRPYAWDDEEITIVLDDLGEEIKKPKPAPGSFLRDIEDL